MPGERGNMKQFKVGKVYQTKSICDHDCVFEITVTGRTEKTISYTYYDGEAKKSKVRYDENGEYVRPESYSMAPVFRASRDLAK